MEKKINVAEMLKDCPKGTKLYSPICGECSLVEVDDLIYVEEEVDVYRFYSDGRYVDTPQGECLLFPSKDHRDWLKWKEERDKEKNRKLPKTWEDFCKTHAVQRDECVVCSNSVIVGEGVFRERMEGKDRSLLPNKELAEAMLALCQLIQLRDCYNNGWKPDWTDDESKYVIYSYNNTIIDDETHYDNRALYFNTKEIRDKFLKNFRGLIEIAKPLL